jgi:carbon storage regulator CsrA
MLVLTRKLQEKIRIGDQITITILRTKGKSVRLGIEAPLEVPVVRGELVFEDGAEQVHVEEIETSDEEVSADGIPADTGRTVAQAVRTMPRWETKSRHHLTANRPPGTASPQVSLQRIPRAEVAQALAAPASAGPLRAMLDRRSLTA